MNNMLIYFLILLLASYVHNNNTLDSIVSSVILRRLDKKPDRVQISEEHLVQATLRAEELAAAMGRLLRVVGSHWVAIHVGKNKMQKEWNSVCGEYCLVYVHNMFYGQSMQDFARIFDEDESLCNDVIINNLFKSYFK